MRRETHTRQNRHFASLWSLLSFLLQSPDRSRLVIYLRDRHPLVLLRLLRMALAANALILGGTEGEEDEEEDPSAIAEEIVPLFKAVAESMRRQLEDGDKALIDREERFEEAFNVIEVSAVQV